MIIMSKPAEQKDVEYIKNRRKENHKVNLIKRNGTCYLPCFEQVTRNCFTVTNMILRHYLCGDALYPQFRCLLLKN